MLIEVPLSDGSVWQPGEALFAPELCGWLVVVAILPERHAAWCEVRPLEVWLN